MIAGTRFSARVILFSAISGLVLTNLNYLSAEDTSVEINSIPRSSTRTVRNPQSTLKNAIQREMHSARRNSTLPRVRFPQTEQQTEQQPAQIQQTGFTLNPKALFQKKSSEPEQKRQIIVNSAAQSTAPQYKTAVPVPEAKPGQSEIQRQLEALYRRDGRQMPPMSMDALPKTANSAGSGRGTVNTTPAPQQTSAPQQSAPQNSAPRNVIVAPQQNVAQESEEKPKWYEMFLPTKTKKTPKKLPKSNQIAKKAPVDTPVTESIEQSASPALPPAPAPETPSIVAGPEQPADTPESVAKSMTPAGEELDEDELEELREEAEERLEEQRIAAKKLAKEAAAEMPVIVEKSPASADAKVVINPDDDFKDLFPEMSEEEADGLRKAKAAEKAASTPFSGLALEEEGLKKTAEKPATPETPAQEKTPQVAQEKPAKDFNPFEPQPQPESQPQPQPTAEKVAKEENPFEVPVEKVAEKAEMPAEKIAETEKPAVQPSEKAEQPSEKIVEKTVEKPLEDNPFKPQPEQKLEMPAPAPEKQVAASEHDSSIEKKLALIASRGNIKGLKGFCPVALRDSRLLVDARPEFSSSYKSMNYQFASLENKLKFDREPAKYAPAAGGSDIVMLVDQQDDKEGTLDFASWYKGRLYLFSSKTNMNVFMKTPALYVGVE